MVRLGHALKLKLPVHEYVGDTVDRMGVWLSKCEVLYSSVLLFGSMI